MPAKDISPQRAEMGWLNMPAGPLRMGHHQQQAASQPRQMGRQAAGRLPVCLVRARHGYSRRMGPPPDFSRHARSLGRCRVVLLVPASVRHPARGRQWFEITESLVYGGEAPLALRLKDPGSTTTSPARDVRLRLSWSCFLPGRVSMASPSGKTRTSGNCRCTSSCGGRSSFWGCRCGCLRSR